MNRRRSNWYIYLITFVVTGVILYIVSNALLSSFYNSQKSADTTQSINTGTVFVPDSNYNFTVLAMLGEKIDDVPGYYMTVTYRGDTNEIILMPYLADTYMNGSTLKGAYASGGEEAVMKALSDNTGLDITKYVRFASSTIVEFINSAGNVTLSIPKELKYEDKEDKTVTIIKAGTTAFSGSQLYTYLTFPDYKESDVQYSCKVHAVVFSSFINQNFNGLTKETLDGYFGYIENYTKTNLTTEDYEQKKQALLYTLQNTNDPCDYYIPYGEQTDNGYVIAQDSFGTVKQEAGTDQD